MPEFTLDLSSTDFHSTFADYDGDHVYEFLVEVTAQWLYYPDEKIYEYNGSQDDARDNIGVYDPPYDPLPYLKLFVTDYCKDMAVSDLTGDVVNADSLLSYDASSWPYIHLKKSYLSEPTVFHFDRTEY